MASSTTQVVKAGYWFCDSQFPVASLDSAHFTHLFASFAEVNQVTNTVSFPGGKLNDFQTFPLVVKEKNSNVKTLISIGGRRSGASTFPIIAGTPSFRKAFIDSSIKLAREYRFDGLCLNWEYPSRVEEMDNLGSLLREWRVAVGLDFSSRHDKEPLLLVAAVNYSSEYNSVSYPTEAIKTCLDWINVVAYDFSSPTSSWQNTQAPAALGQNEAGITKWIEAGVPNRKLVLGLPFYGYAWKLVNTNSHGVQAPADGPANGQANGVKIAPDGAMVYYDIVEFKKKAGVNVEFEPAYVTNICYIVGNIWIGYDDVESIRAKLEYAKNMGLLGYIAWHVGDDYNWTLSATASRAWEA